MTNKTQFLSTQTQEEKSSPPAPEQKSYLGRTWDNSKWAVGGAAWVLSRPVAWAFSPVGEGLGSGAVSGAKKEIEQLVQPDGPLGIQLKETLEEALLRQPTEELLELKTLLSKSITSPETLTEEEILKIQTNLKELSDDGEKLLRHLAPDISEEAIKVFHVMIELFELANEMQAEKDGHFPENFRELLQNPTTKQLLEKCDELFTLILDRNRGALIKSLEYLRNALLSEQNGILSQAIEFLNGKCIGETDGLIPKAIAMLEKKLNENLAALEKQLTEEGGIADKGVNYLQSRLIDKDGLLDKAMKLLDEGLNDKEKGVLVKAQKFLSDSLIDDKEGIIVKAINFLNDKLLEKGGLIEKIDLYINEEEKGLLARAASCLDVKFKAIFDQFDEKINLQAHTLLSKSRSHLVDLREAIITNKTAAIKKYSKELQELLEQLAQHHVTVFTKKPLDNTDLQLLNQLKDKLSDFYGNTPPSQGEMMLAVAGGLSVISSYYLVHAGAVERAGDVFIDAAARAGDVFVEKVNPILSRVENLPKTLVESGKSALGFAPSQTPPVPTSPSAPQPAGAPNEATLSQFLAHGSSLLKSMIEKGGNAISQQARSSFAGVLSIGLQQALKKMDNSEVYKQTKMTLKGIISTLDNFQENEDWNQLYIYLKETSEVLSGVKIYINGFRTPRLGATSGTEKNAEVIYSDNMALLQGALDAPSPEPESQDWRERANTEKNKLVKNTANFLTIKHIFEDVCKLTPTNERFYLELLAKAQKKGVDQSESELKKLFFEELDKKNVSFITKAYAKVQYYFYGSIVKRFTEKATTIYFDEIFKYIEGHKAEKFDTLRNQVTTNFTRYLTILGGAYKTVAATTTPTGTLDEMIKAELEKKESNLGFETKELYMEFAQTVLKKTTESTLLTWIAKKFIGNPETIVRSIIDKATGSLQDTRGYTHALNCVIREQLDEVWGMLQTDQTNPQNGQNPRISSEISEGKKTQLAGLVKNLFEILRKTKCHTVDELRDLVEGKLVSAKVNQAVDDLFIEEVLEKVTNILAMTLQSLVKEDQLQKLTYKFASLVNRTFEVGIEATVEQMQDEERKIAKRCEQILSLAINTAVEEKFDFSGKKQQKETNHFIEGLHKRSTTYFASTEQDLIALAQMDIESLEACSKLEKLVIEAMDYESECFHCSFQAKGSKVSSDNKDEISRRYLGIAEQSKPLISAIAELKQHANTLQHHRTTVPHLQQIKGIIPTIGLRIFPNAGATLEDLDYAENQMRILETHLEELRKERHLAEVIALITTESQIIARILVDLRKAIKTRSLGIEQAKPNSLIDQIATEKKQNLGQIIGNPGLKGKFATLRESLRQSVDGTFLQQLWSKLSTIEEASHSQQIDTAYQEFLALFRQAVDESNRTIEQERQKHFLSFGKIYAAIDGTHLLDPTYTQNAKNGVRAAIASAQGHLHTLSEWESKNVKEVPYINFSFVDMKGIQDWASGLIYGRVRERLDGFMDFLKHEETYRYGLLNHLFLIPYTQAIRSAKK